MVFCVCCVGVFVFPFVWLKKMLCYMYSFDCFLLYFVWVFCVDFCSAFVCVASVLNVWCLSCFVDGGYCCMCVRFVCVLRIKTPTSTPKQISMCRRRLSFCCCCSFRVYMVCVWFVCVYAFVIIVLRCLRLFCCLFCF